MPCLHPYITMTSPFEISSSQTEQLRVVMTKTFSRLEGSGNLLILLLSFPRSPAERLCCWWWLEWVVEVIFCDKFMANQTEALSDIRQNVSICSNLLEHPMKQRRFNPQDYLKDLENIEFTLERVRSESKSSSVIHKSYSSKNVVKEDLPLRTLERDFQNRVAREGVRDKEKGNELVRTKPMAKWVEKTKQVGLLGEGQTENRNRDKDRELEREREIQKERERDRKITGVQKLNTEQEDSIREPPKQPSLQPIHFTPTQQNKFVNSLSHLYQVTPKDLPCPLSRLIKEIESRDQVYRTVSEMFPSENPKNYTKCLVQSQEREKMMLKIIKQFKAMSRVDIDDLGELYSFLREE